MSDLPILDPRPLQDLLDIGVGTELVQELITLLKEDAPPRLVLVKAALASGDDSVVIQETHQLKGALGNLGLQRFANLAAQIEAHVRNGHRESAQALAEQLPGAYEESLAALEAAFPGV